jgi:hypothetical protein
MSLLMPASEVAVGDYVDGFGTVTKVIENRGADENLSTVGFEYFNGLSSPGLNPEAMLSVTQGGPGGLKERMPDPNEIRPGLAEAHRDGR